MDPQDEMLFKFRKFYPNVTPEQVEELDRCIRNESLLAIVGPCIVGSTVMHALLSKKLGMARPMITIFTGMSILAYQRIRKFKMCVVNTLGPPNLPVNHTRQRTYPPITPNADSIGQQGYPSQDYPSSDYVLADKPSWSNTGTGFENKIFDDTSNQFEMDETDAKVKTEKKRITYDDLFHQSQYHNENRRDPIVRPPPRSNVGVPPSYQEDNVFEDTKLPEEKEYVWG